MAELKQILCPVDFSDSSHKAAHYAVDFARAVGAGVTLLHVYHLPAHSALVEAPHTVADLSQELRRAIDEEFRALIAQLNPGPVTIGTMLAVGVPYVQIVDVAATKGADMIVMGAMGHSRITRLLLGSVAERVVRSSKVPVLVVPI